MERYYCSFAFVTIWLFYFSDIFTKKVTKTKWLQLLINTLLTAISLLLAYQIIYLFVRGEWLPSASINVNVGTVALVVIVVKFFMQYENAKIASLMQEKDYELTKQKELKTRADLNALQARINPHFLYNALNSIAALSRIDSKRTENMALSLSNLFRYHLNREEEWIIPLGKEIEMIKLYLDIEKQRFSDRLDFRIMVDESLHDISIPRFIIQPLVENAIKQGISKIKAHGIVILKVYKEDKFLVIEIHDNGPDFPKGILTGYGLQNVYDKLTLIHKKPYEVKFVNYPEKFVQIKL